MSTPLSETELLKACRILFGNDVELSREFLFYIQPCGAKSAYRRQAKAVHPDFFANEEFEVQKSRTEQFRNLNQAYELLCSFFTQREKGIWRSSTNFTACAKPRSPRPAAQPGAAEDAGSSRKGRGDHFYRGGKVPFRICETGTYLYYKGLIPFSVLVEALVWQRGQRPSMGQLALRWGWLKASDIREVLASRNSFGRFGEKAIQLGILTPFQVRTLLFFQRSRHKKLGQFFVEKGLFSSEEIELLVHELQEHNDRVITGRRPGCRRRQAAGF